jgi:hypothetical protein
VGNTSGLLYGTQRVMLCGSRGGSWPDRRLGHSRTAAHRGRTPRSLIKDECSARPIQASDDGKGRLDMKKFQILGLALVAVFAFSAIAAASAFAESEWLVGGAPIAAGKTVKVLSEGELKLCDHKGGLFLEEACVKCSGLNQGIVGPNKTDEVQEVTNLAGTSKDITDCTNALNCPTPILVEADNLPWPTEVYLNGTEFRDLVGAAGVGKQPGYLVKCFGIEDLCEGHTSVRLENSGANDVLSTFEAPLTENSNCTRGGNGEGLATGTNLLFTDSPDGALSVS